MGIQYGPESLQGMRENLDRVLQFMASKHIKMHNISSRYIHIRDGKESKEWIGK